MKRQVWADEQVMELVTRQFVPFAIDVNAPKNAEMVAHYKIEGSPVTIITDSQGNVFD